MKVVIEEVDGKVSMELHETNFKDMGGAVIALLVNMTEFLQDAGMNKEQAIEFINGAVEAIMKDVTANFLKEEEAPSQVN